MNIPQYNYKRVSDETKARIYRLDIVSPSTYTSIFSDIAKECHVDLEDENSVVSEVMDEKLTNFTKMRDQVSGHASELNANAARAVDAIQHSDDSILQEVLAETKALRKEIEELKSAVYKDLLTKVYNRKWFEDNCLCNENKTFSEEGVLALIDMNYFKQINDTYGHITGDKVLAYMAAQLMRTGGDVVRYGGDEFFVLFRSGVSLEKAMNKMHAIREAVMKKLFKTQEKTFKISFSVGLTPFKGGDSLSDAVEAADTRMYQDKKKIKARIEAR